MTPSLRTKLVLSYLAIAVLTALSIYLLIRLTSDQRLKTLLLEQQIAEIQNEVTVWYAAEGSWDGFSTYFQTLHPPKQREQQQDGTGPPPGRHGVVDAEKRALTRVFDFEPGTVVPDGYLAKAVPVVVDGQAVAWVVPDNESGISLKAEEQIYLRSTNQVLLIAIIVGIGGALLMGIIFSRVLLRPIFALTKASNAMSQGNLKQQVNIHSQDELGQLATSFNTMSQAVAHSNQRRRQMTADIAHDLGTPLQIIAGYVETIQGGELEATPERIDIIAAETEHLRRLINDLDILAQTDINTLSLNLEEVTLAEYLPQIAAKFAPSAAAKSVTLQLDPPSEALPPVRIDRERLAQVMGNVLTNALRHTPTEGTIRVTAKAVCHQVQLQVFDSGVGIAAAELPFVFDRFYQTDRSRSDKGKMGLGLAISKALVEAMGGEISAKSNGYNQGTTFTIALPTWG